jgi:hypothetical protein
MTHIETALAALDSLAVEKDTDVLGIIHDWIGSWGDDIMITRGALDGLHDRIAALVDLRCKRALPLTVEPSEDALTIHRLISNLTYILGIVVRGTGEPVPQKMPITKAIRDYVKSMEAGRVPAKPVEPSEDAREFAVELLAVNGFGVVHDNDIDAVSALITARDERIRRECADIAVDWIECTVEDDLTDYDKNDLINRIMGEAKK